MPVITMLTLKLVIPLMLDETLNVSVAAVDCPTPSTVLSLFQLKLIELSAPVGLQPFVAMLSVSCASPVFLMYIVLTTEPPGEIVPQSMDVKFWVQLLSE